MRKKFCPRCGRETDQFFSGLCQNCFLETTTFISLIPEKISLNQCRNCGKFYVGKFSGETREGVLEKFLAELFSKKEVKELNYRIQGNKLFLTLSSKIQSIQKKEQRVVELIQKKIICEDCSLKKFGYYVSTIQVRAPIEKLNKLKNDFVEKIELLNKIDRNAFISKIEQVKNGIDIYVGSKSAANNSVSSLKNKYKASIKMSRKLTGSIRGKKAYRDTILFSVK